MVYWTSLREVSARLLRLFDHSLNSVQEPVIYVAGRPHVLRLVDKPLENVECVIFTLLSISCTHAETHRATGVTTSVVEAMEKEFKRDVIREVQAGSGRILLHDEVEERPGVFSIIPIWEQVEEKDIMTPADVYNLMVEEGYKASHHDQCTV